MNIQKLGRSLSYAARQQSRYIQRHLGPMGVAPRTLPFYMTVSRHEGMSQKELTEHIGTDKTQTTKAIDCLEQRGYIERRKNPDDHRVNGIFLTEEGQRLLPEVREVLDRLDGIVSASLTDEETNRFIGMLEAFAAALRQDFGESS